jgi:hypothetical protein
MGRRELGTRFYATKVIKFEAKAKTVVVEWI